MHPDLENTNSEYLPISPGAGVDDAQERIAVLFISLITKMRRKGASIRSLARLFGWSKSDMGRIMQLIDQRLVAQSINLFERERRNDVSAQAIADHLNLPVAVILGALNRMLRANDHEASHLGQRGENSSALSTAAE